MAFADLLKSQREAAGLTQAELAEKAGIAQQSISRYEKGEREPTWAAVQAIATALGVSVTVFLEPDPPDNKPTGNRPKK